mmetsp:Transcript_15069/g.20514  ORF Transcript_15069/g.20514 Transcript_15069/m.20514 type:complete len:150 (-) Transcript_15069:204-653(-)
MAFDPSRTNARFGSPQYFSTISSEGVYWFLSGALYGGVWGIVTPFHHPGTSGAIAEMKTGKFKPAPPFSSLQSMGANATFFGSIVAIQRMSSKSMELARRSEDEFNDLFGFLCTLKYYQSFLSSTRRYIVHNRVIGAGFTFTLAYALLS